MDNYAELAGQNSLEHVLEKVGNRIQEISIIKSIPAFLSEQLFSVIANNFNAMLYLQPVKSNGFREEGMSEVPCITKDSLMPKQLSRQSVIHDNQSTLNINASSLGVKNKRLALSKLTSLSKSTRLSQGEAVSNKLSKLNKSQKQEEIRMEALKPEEVIEDPQIDRLRFRTQRRLQDELEYKKLQFQHQKSFNQKLQALQSLQLDDPAVTITHDYDGESLKSMFIDDKISYYAARPGIGAAKKQFKDGNKIYVPPEPSYIGSKKNWKEKDNSKELRAMQMPLFPQTQANIIPTQGFRNYRMNEYRKHFGRGYSRLDQVSQTIDYSPSKDPADGIFSQRKHLNDSIELSTLSRSVLKNSHVSRRLALPKLHGRYKVLDRYEQL